VSIAADARILEIGHSTGITATVTGDNKNLNWFVNGVKDGNDVYGTITQNSAATYNAPDSLPDQSTITIVAESVEDETITDTCSIDLEFTRIIVKSDVGNDNTATGSVNLPAKTITRGLALADTGMTVLVFPGLYDVHNGEEFQLEIPGDVALVGMDWESCIIRGHGTQNYNATILMDHPGSQFRKFTLEMGEPEDEQWDLAIRVRDDDQMVDSIRIFERGDFSVLRTGGADNSVIQNCYFVVNDGETRHRAYEIAGASDNLIIRNCTAIGFNEGIFVNGMQEPLIEGCTLTGNNHGVGLWYEPPLSDPNPDLGGGARGSAGGNNLSGNTSCGINNRTTNAIYAKSNTWDNDPPVEGEDYCNSGTGSVITE
jgi:parallel beta-helix repeat protein